MDRQGSQAGVGTFESRDSESDETKRRSGGVRHKRQPTDVHMLVAHGEDRHLSERERHVFPLTKPDDPKLPRPFWC